MRVRRALVVVFAVAAVLLMGAGAVAGSLRLKELSPLQGPVDGKPTPRDQLNCGSVMSGLRSEFHVPTAGGMVDTCRPRWVRQQTLVMWLLIAGSAAGLMAYLVWRGADRSASKMAGVETASGGLAG